MKATLEFNLPEEQDAFERAVKGSDALILVHSLLSEIRSFQKYDTGAFAKCDGDTLETIREWVWEHINDYRLPEL
jgi:hypothetical protein